MSHLVANSTSAFHLLESVDHSNARHLGELGEVGRRLTRGGARRAESAVDALAIRGASRNALLDTVRHCHATALRLGFEGSRSQSRMSIPSSSLIRTLVAVSGFCVPFFQRVIKLGRTFSFAASFCCKPRVASFSHNRVEALDCAMTVGRVFLLRNVFKWERTWLQLS